MIDVQWSRAGRLPSRLLFLALALMMGARAVADAAPPNFLFILADDLGYGDLGCYGQTRIRTPHLDQLAAQGARFTRHYAGSPVCAPSRCVLLTGKHPGHAWIRDNRELREEGQEPLPAGTPTFLRTLQTLGYQTGAFGKWGLGPPASTGNPLRQGLHQFYGYNCQRHAHNHYPAYLWDNERRVRLDNPPFPAHQTLPADADPRAPDFLARYRGQDYAPDLIFRRAGEFIRANRNRPFFCHVPITVPHLALQVPEDSLAEYRGVLPDELYAGQHGYLPHPTPHAAYAAMVTRLDREVGRLLALLQELGLEENTVVVFTSDNGPAAGRTGGADSDFFESAAGLRGRKGSVYEGGLRVPLLVRWPARIRPGRVCDRVTGFEDWFPTLLELAGGAALVPKDIDGVSFAPTLLGRRQKARLFLYREYPGGGGQQCVLMGDWKAVRTELDPRFGPLGTERPVELYHLRRDPAEVRNVAQDHPRVASRLDRMLRLQHAVAPVFPFPRLDRVAIESIAEPDPSP